MVDRPILFSGPMVRALLAGTKTQTRRIVPKQPTQRPDGLWDHHGYEYGNVAADEAAMGQWLADFQRIEKGDCLWVRESLKIESTDQGVRYPTYAADGAKLWPLSEWKSDRNAVPSIHMWRWASRLTLNVTDVRVERLKDISEADALAEGVKPWPLGEWLDMPGFASVPAANVPAKTLYCYLWEHINGQGSWTENPWVAAYTFTVHRGNIDAPA